jgi:ribokinase
MEGDLDAEI